MCRRPEGQREALWASLHAFGTPPPLAAVVMAYFVGQLANVIPLPGGVGGVEGGTIAALIAFGAQGSLAVLGVLAYRLISFWPPTAPGALAYIRLRRTVTRWRAAAQIPGPSHDDAVAQTAHLAVDPVGGAGPWIAPERRGAP